MRVVNKYKAIKDYKKSTFDNDWKNGNKYNNVFGQVICIDYFSANIYNHISILADTICDICDCHTTTKNHKICQHQM
jgi:hypothetical protein